MIVLLDGIGFNLNAHRSETEQNGAAAQSLMLIHIVHSGFELFISRFPTVKYFIISKQPVGYLGLFDKIFEHLLITTSVHDNKSAWPYSKPPLSFPSLAVQERNGQLGGVWERG